MHFKGDDGSSPTNLAVAADPRELDWLKHGARDDPQLWGPRLGLKALTVVVDPRCTLVAELFGSAPLPWWRICYDGFSLYN